VKRGRFSEARIIGILKERGGFPVVELCRNHGSGNDENLHKRKAKYRGLEVGVAKRLSALEDGNAKLKQCRTKRCAAMSL